MTDVADLFGAMLSAPPLPEAACRNQWQLFDLTIPENPGKVAAETTRARNIALSLCRGCPEISACRQWLDGLPSTRKPLGVVAGIVIDRRAAREVA